MPEKDIKKPDIMHAVAAAIIRGRYVILLAFLAAMILSIVVVVKLVRWQKMGTLNVPLP